MASKLSINKEKSVMSVDTEYSADTENTDYTEYTENTMKSGKYVIKSVSRAVKQKTPRAFEIIPTFVYDEIEYQNPTDPADINRNEEIINPNVARPGQIYLEIDREKWSNPIDALFSMMGSAVAISNLSRFPFLCYKHGGVAFLIPYFLFVVVGGFPMLYMELILGQFVQQGSIGIWKIVPLFKGIGYCIVLIMILLSMYYSSVITWSLIFIVGCFTNSILPWTTCNNPWNTPNCSAIVADEGGPGTLSPGAEYFRGRILQIWQSEYADGIEGRNKSFFVDGFVKYGLNSEEGLGNIVTQLCLGSFVIFLGIFVVLITGTKVSGKVIMLLTTVPYGILAILFFRAVTLPGATEGVKILFTPNFTYLTKFETWSTASIQTFFSLSTFGVHQTIASHNYFYHNIFRDAIITAAADTLVSLVGGVVIFSYLGNLAMEQRKNVTDITRDGIGLIFETFPDALGINSGARFFSFIVFTMLIFLGCSPYIGIHQVIASAVTEEFKKWFPPKTRTDRIFIFAYLSIAFLGHQMCLTRGGIWVYLFMERFTAGHALLIALLFQTIGVSWIWGIEDLCNAAEAMTGRMPGIYLRLCWKFVIPASLTTILVVSLQGDNTFKYEGEPLPADAKTFGMIWEVLPVICIPIYAFYQLIYYSKGKGFKQRLCILLCPENEHNQIIATGSCGDRLTLKHFLYFGCFAKRKQKISPAGQVVPSVVAAFEIPTIGVHDHDQDTETQNADIEPQPSISSIPSVTDIESIGTTRETSYSSLQAPELKKQRKSRRSRKSRESRQ